MPLIKSASDKARSANIAAEMRAGRKPDQAAAIAYRVQRDAKKMSKGGRIKGYASGGSTPFTVRAQAKGLERAGMINSPVAGRTDKLPMGVKAGSYVMPADAISALGQGNSMAGANAMNRLLKMGPYGSAAGAMPRAAAPMRMGKIGKGFADGGMADPDMAPGGPPTEIVAAGGEFIVPPDRVAELGGGSLDKGHDILDSMVMQVRKKAIKTLRKLPKPKKR